MISSAYRSLQDQQATYDSYVAECGTACANQYVLPVGASEHHTGLAVDFSSASDQCAADSDDCSLGASAVTWLADNAWRYGFIHRYPEGKQSITGVAQESWHYRYVGIVMAKAMHGSGLTYDEVVQQLAPGYAK
jgi:D-alanyl-D-alanine carboxypeptidase